MEVTQTHLRYLLAIYQEAARCGEVRSSVVAKKLSVSKPSMAKMLCVLADKGFVTKEPYGTIQLTETGKALAHQQSEKISVWMERVERMGLALTYEETRSAALALLETLSRP